MSLFQQDRFRMPQGPRLALILRNPAFHSNLSAFAFIFGIG